MRFVTGNLQPTFESFHLAICQTRKPLETPETLETLETIKMLETSKMLESRNKRNIMLDKKTDIVRVTAFATVNSEAEAKYRVDGEVSAEIRDRMEAKRSEIEREES